MCLCASVVKSAKIARFQLPRTQTRHLARIFTVDFPKMRELNSWRRVSDISETVPRAQWVRSQDHLAENKGELHRSYL